MKHISLKFIILVMFLGISRLCSAQPQFTGDTLSIRFDNWTGVGFEPGGDAGRLDSRAWIVNGLTDGAMDFGNTKLGGDFGRGESTGRVTAGGVYAFKPSGSIRLLGFQPTGTDLAPGSVTLRVQVQDGGTLNAIGVGYDLWYLNDQGRSTSVDLEWSIDGASFHPMDGGAIATPAAADADPTWVHQQAAGTAVLGTGTSVSQLYIRWNMKDNGGSGSRDEWGLEEVRIYAVDQVPTNPSPVFATLIKFDFNDETDLPTEVNSEQFDAHFGLSRANRAGYAAGSPGRAANSTGWGNMNGAWVMRLSTVGFVDLAVASKQYSSATGPRDFSLEWSNDSLQWKQVTVYQVRNSFSDIATGRGVLLPIEAQGQPRLWLRWRNFTNTSAEDRIVSNNGSSRIDEIAVTGLPVGTYPPILATPRFASEDDRIRAQIEVLSQGSADLASLTISCNQSDGEATLTAQLPLLVRQAIQFQSEPLPRPSRWLCSVRVATLDGETTSNYIAVEIAPPPPPFAYAPTVQAQDIRLFARTDTTLHIYWQKGDGEFSLLAHVPEDVSSCEFDEGRTYIGHLSLQQGDITRNGCKVIWSGVGDQAFVFGLTALQSERFTVVEFNGEPGRESYLEQNQQLVMLTTRAAAPGPLGEFRVLQTTQEGVTLSWNTPDGADVLLVASEQQPTANQLLKFLDDGLIMSGFDIIECASMPCTVARTQLGERRLFGYTIAGPIDHRSIQIQEPSIWIPNWPDPTLGQLLAKWDFDDQQYSPSWSIWEHQIIRISVDGARDRGFASGFQGHSSYTDQWNAPELSKAWVINMTTHGLSDAMIEMRIISSASGPGSFQVVCGVEGEVHYSDDVITASTTWSQSHLQRIRLADACLNQKYIQIRITPASDTAVNGNAISRSGTSRLDDVQIFGTYNSGAVALMGELQIVSNDDNGVRLIGSWISSAGRLPLSQYLEIESNGHKSNIDYSVDDLDVHFHLKNMSAAAKYSIRHCGVTDLGDSCGQPRYLHTPYVTPPNPIVISAAIVEPDGAEVRIVPAATEIVALLAPAGIEPPVITDSTRVTDLATDKIKVYPRQSSFDPVKIEGLRPGARFSLWLVSVNGPDSTVRYSRAPYTEVELVIPPLSEPEKPKLSFNVLERDFNTVHLALQVLKGSNMLYTVTRSDHFHTDPEDDVIYTSGISYNSGDVLGANSYVVGPVVNGTLHVRGLPLGSKWVLRAYAFNTLHGAATYSREFTEYAFESLPDPRISPMTASTITALVPGDTLWTIGTVLWSDEDYHIIHVPSGNVQVRLSRTDHYRHELHRIAIFGRRTKQGIDVIDYYELEPDPSFRSSPMVIHPDSTTVYAVRHPWVAVGNIIRAEGSCGDGSPMYRQRSANSRLVCLTGNFGHLAKDAFLDEWAAVAIPIYSTDMNMLTLFVGDESSLIAYQPPQAVHLSPNKGEIITWTSSSETSVKFEWKLKDAVRPFDHFPDSISTRARFITRTIDEHIIIDRPIDLDQTSLSLPARDLHRMHSGPDSLNLNASMEWTLALYDQRLGSLDAQSISGWQPFQLLRLKALADTDIMDIPTSFRLDAARPNPFNPSTVVRVHIPQAGPFELMAYDVVGRPVAIVHKGNLNAGVYDLVWDAGRLSSGVYLLRSIYGRIVQTTQVTLIK